MMLLKRFNKPELAVLGRSDKYFQFLTISSTNQWGVRDFNCKRTSCKRSYSGDTRVLSLKSVFKICIGLFTFNGKKRVQPCSCAQEAKAKIWIDWLIKEFIIFYKSEKHFETSMTKYQLVKRCEVMTWVNPSSIQ